MKGAQRLHLTLTLPVGAGVQLLSCIVAPQTGALPAAPPVRQPGLEIGVVQDETNLASAIIRPRCSFATGEKASYTYNAKLYCRATLLRSQSAV